MIRILTLIAAVASLSLVSCAGMKKKSCCAVKPGAEKACCVAKSKDGKAKAKDAKCESCDKPAAKTETKKKA